MSHLAPTLAVLLLCLASAPVPAGAILRSWGPPALVADLERVPVQSSSSPGGMVRLGSYIYFGATDPVHGPGLWRSDGTEAGTVLVADVCPGFCGSLIYNLTAAGDRVFFTLSLAPGLLGDLSSDDLWVSDGSAAGTRRLGRFQATDLRGSALDDLTALGDRLLFSAADREHGRELWVSDGTAAGTARIADLCAGPCSSGPGTFAVLDGRAFFLAAQDAPGGRGLWSTDGTAAGTRQVRGDVQPWGQAPIFAAGERLFVLTRMPETGFPGLWALDSGADELRFVTELGSWDAGFASLPLNHAGPFAIGGTVYLPVAAPAGEPRLWRTNGTAAGTRPAEEILAAGRTDFPAWTAVAGGKLFFAPLPLPSASLFDPVDLWVLEAGAGAARRVEEGPSVPACCTRGVALGDRLVLSAAGPPAGLWSTDGTKGGSRLLTALPGGLHLPQLPALTRLGDVALFGADDGVHGSELWITDGSASGTRLLADLAPPSASSSPRELSSVPGSLFFLANERGGRPALWRTTPEATGAELVEADAPYEELAVSGETLFLHDQWNEEDTFQGTLSSLRDGSSTASPLPVPGRFRNLTSAPGDRLFFARGDELWVSDGSPAGTVELYDVGAGDGPPGGLGTGFPSPPYALVMSGETLFFAGFGETAFELWKSDGTAEGTAEVAGEIGIPRGLVPVVGGVLFSAGGSGIHPLPTSLWWSDGTPGGTRTVRELWAQALTSTGDFALFFTRAAGGGLRLWRTDGTAPGTAPVAHLGAAGETGWAREAVAAGGRLFFTLFTPEMGDELWVSDGTAAGTRLVRDLHPGPADSRPAHLTAVGDLLAFAADDGVAGQEPWLTDGTAAGTVRIADLHPGSAPSTPSDFARVDDRLYLVADDGESGRELWVVRLGAAGEEPPPIPPDATLLEPTELAGFRLWVLITSGGSVQPSRQDRICLPETVCVSGAVPGRSELFVRVVGPKPNGYLWPTLVRFSTSTIDVWIEQLSSGLTRHYRLDGVSPASSELPGLFDRHGFQP